MPIVRAARPRTTFADLQRVPDDGRRYELYDGEVRVVPSPIPRHQMVIANLHQRLARHADARGGLSLLAPLDIVFSDYDVVQPDIVFFSAPRRYLVNPDEAIRHAPDLVVEVLSPGTQEDDRGRKMRMFARYGVTEYWIADPATACLEVHVLDDDRPATFRLDQTACGSDAVRSARLAGLTFAAADAFRVP